MATTETDTTVQSVFEQFEANVVRIPRSEDLAAQEVHPKVREALRRRLGPLLIDDFLSGSYGRRVQVAPKLKDVDVVLTLDDPSGIFRQSATAALRAIELAALTCDLISETELRCRSVRAWLHEYDFTVDLVASLAFPGHSGLLLARRIPDEGKDDWSYGDPKGQRQAAVDKNASCDGMYRPATRLVKFWKNGASGLFKSYHAESILFHSLSGPLPYAEALVRFFDAAYEALAPGVLTEDPGAPGTFVDERLEDHERFAARQAVEVARRHAHDATLAESIEDQLNGWARVFGPAFPAPSNADDAVASSLADRTAGVTGLGVTAHEGQRAVQPRSWRSRS